MANGSVVNVNAATHPDLAQAMRGSGGQFGIVTQFKAKVHHMGDIWGGSCAYDATKDDELYAALHNFVGNGAEDPKAAIIFSDLVLAAGITTKLIFYFYDNPTPPTSGPFADFFRVLNLACVPKTQKYSELVSLLCSHIAISTSLLSTVESKRRTGPSFECSVILSRKDSCTVCMPDTSR